MSEKAEVPARAKQAEPAAPEWEWVDRNIWTERMLAAPGNGVKGNEYFAKIGAIHHDKRPNGSEPIPMRKPQSGEPCAGEPHARFGGRGGREPFSTPIKLLMILTRVEKYPE